jgi:hypothetical protein
MLGQTEVFQALKLWCYGAVQQFKLLVFATRSGLPVIADGSITARHDHNHRLLIPIPKHVCSQPPPNPGYIDKPAHNRPKASLRAPVFGHVSVSWCFDFSAVFLLTDQSLQEHSVYFEGPLELGFAEAKLQLRAMPISSQTDKSNHIGRWFKAGLA